RLVYRLRVVIGRFIVCESVKNAADVQLRIDRENCSLQDDPEPHLPAVLTRQRVVDDYPLAIALPRCNLIRWYCNVPEYFEKFFGIGAELRKKILRLLIFVNPSKPRDGDHRNYAGQRANFFAVVGRKAES